MRISNLSTVGPGGGAPILRSLAGAAAILNDPAGAAGLDRQLKAYQALAERWRQASHGERAALDPLLHDSAFGRRVQSTLNAFTRAAWAGPDAAPPEPQARILQAFDDLSEADQQVVAAMQADAAGAPAMASVEAYRARLRADLDEASAPQRRPDSITLSDAARARLAGAYQPDGSPVGPEPQAQSVRPDLARAIAAYARAAQ